MQLFEIKNNKYIYIVFSTTPYKIGTFIRRITRCEFNHVSVALDSKLFEMYSFARYYKNTPFYGGFVRETKGRYFNRGRFANIKICRMRVTDEQFLAAKTFLNEMSENSERYRYNLISALLYPLRTRINIPNAFTCVEFVVEFFNSIKLDLGIKQGKFCSTVTLSNKLDKYEIYTGSISNFIDKHKLDEDSFPKIKGFRKKIKLTLASNGKLIKSLVTKKV